jgi:hypothetical protein
MSTRTRWRTLPELAARLAREPAPGSFDDGELDEVPDPVRRYLRASIAPGAPLALTARFAMRGRIKLGRRWVPFRARQVYGPHDGLLWRARAGGIISGYDRYADGEGAMEWKLFGLIPVVRVGGPDTSRSSAGRVGAEAVWVPTALLPRFGVVWRATDDHHATASYRLDDNELTLDFVFDDRGQVRSVAIDRWADAEGAGRFAYERFGHELTRHATFDGVTVPIAGRGGWFHGTSRWSEGEFFRYELTDFQFVTSNGRDDR